MGSLRTAVGEELTPEGSEAKMLHKMNALGLAILSIMASTAEARRGGGFLFICFGDCEPWQYALMALSIVLTILCCCCYGCLKVSNKLVERRLAELQCHE